jgi:hypothetical protein
MFSGNFLILLLVTRILRSSRSHVATSENIRSFMLQQPHCWLLVPHLSGFQILSFAFEAAPHQRTFSNPHSLSRPELEAQM